MKIPLKSRQLVLFFIGIIAWQTASARTARYRVMWRDNPATTMVIGWDQVTGSGPRLYYDVKDYRDNKNRYAFSEPPHYIVESKGMNNHFVRLQNLQPNTVYYFVIADSDGTSQRYSFRTAPARPDVPLSIVAGGDSRNYRAARRYANRMVGKLRPNFVLFAGDMTGGDSGAEWIVWLNDWQESFGEDGRIFPIVVARGNHESSNRSLIDIFDVARPELYYAHTFGGNLLRIYTLNSMIAVGGNQRNWLEADLQRNASGVRWRMAQYHHAIRPHTRGKSEKDQQMIHWAPLFYAYQMDLVLESDSHTVKWTYPIKPSRGEASEEGFVRDDANGTVFIGEGCWGAPIRNNNDAKSWTRASGSFNQFKLIFVREDRIEVRTVLTDQVERAPALTEDQRFTLPPNFPIWQPPTGSVVTLLPRSTDQSALQLKPNETQPDGGTTDRQERSRRNIREWSKLPRIEFNREQEVAVVPFTLAHRGNVTIKVFDVYSEKIMEIDLSDRQPGAQKTFLALPKLREGIYLVSVKQKDKTLHYYQLLSE